MPASSPETHVESENDLPVEHAGDARRSLVVADRVEQPAEAGAPQREHDQRGERHEQQQRVRDAIGPARAEPGQELRNLRARGDHRALVDLQALRCRSGSCPRS